MTTTERNAPKMKNKRLSGYDREKLVALARKHIAATADTTALDETYERAADHISRVVAAKWPQKDMAVLAKYDVADADACIYASTGGGDYGQFHFRAGDKRIPLRPKRRHCSSHPVLLEGEAADAYRAHEQAEKAHKATQAQRLNDFKALIEGSRSFNEIEAVWPAASELRSSIVGESAALTVLSEDVVARIKADPAFAVAA